MPTVRPRHLVTESDRLKEAIDEAARRWPEETSRAKLLARLAEEGYEALQRRTSTEATGHRAAVERTSGALTGAYGPGYLTALREEWPA